MNQYISIRSMTYVWQIVISSYYSILENKGLWSYTSKAFQIFYNEEEPIHWIKWIHFYIVIRCIISCFGPLDRSWIHTTIFMHRKLFFCSSSPLSLSLSLCLSPSLETVQYNLLDYSKWICNFTRSFHAAFCVVHPLSDDKKNNNNLPNVPNLCAKLRNGSKNKDYQWLSSILSAFLLFILHSCNYHTTDYL